MTTPWLTSTCPLTRLSSKDNCSCSICVAGGSSGTSGTLATRGTERRSARAAEILLKAGYEKVANVAGGLIQWSRLALPFRDS